MDAQANGDWHTGATWVGGVHPEIGDDVDLKSFDVTWTTNEAINCASLTADAGGNLVCSQNGETLTLTATNGITAGTADLLQFSGNSVINIVTTTVGIKGSGTAGTDSDSGLNYSGTGTVNITGDVTGGAWAATNPGIEFSGSGTINMLSGDVIAGTTGCYGIDMSGAGTLNITGSLAAGGNALALNADGAGGTVTISGDVEPSNATAMLSVGADVDVTISGDVYGGGIVFKNAVTFASTGSLYIGGDVDGSGAGFTHTTIAFSAAGDIEVVGDVTGGSNTSTPGIVSSSSGTITVHGTVTGGGSTTGQAISCTGTGVMTLNGNIIHSATTLAITGRGNYDVSGMGPENYMEFAGGSRLFNREYWPRDRGRYIPG